MLWSSSLLLLLLLLLVLSLVEHALAHQEEAALTGPIAVHCRLILWLLDLVAVVVLLLLLMMPLLLSLLLVLGLVEHALAHQEEAALTGPIAVHCR